MIVEIKRLFVKSGLEAPVMLNTDYIMKIMPNEEPDKPRTRIIFDSGASSEGPDIIYTDETYAAIKAKVTNQRKRFK